MRIYDSRVGRFLSLDPLTKSYPWYTPYQFAGNKPIWAKDLDGLEELFATMFYNSVGELYKTVITIAADVGMPAVSAGVTTIIHYSRVDVDTHGDVTVSYQGSLKFDFRKEIPKSTPGVAALKNLLQSGKLGNMQTAGKFKISTQQDKPVKDITYYEKNVHIPQSNQIADLPENINAVPKNPNDRYLYDPSTNSKVKDGPIGTWGKDNPYQSSQEVPSWGGKGVFKNQPTEQQAKNNGTSGQNPARRNNGDKSITIN